MASIEAFQSLLLLFPTAEKVTQKAATEIFWLKLNLATGHVIFFQEPPRFCRKMLPSEFMQNQNRIALVNCTPHSPSKKHPQAFRLVSLCILVSIGFYFEAR